MNEFTTPSSNRGNGADKFCPVLSDPEPDCYCFNLDSQRITFALKYCQGNYLACDIYQRVINRGGPARHSKTPDVNGNGGNGGRGCTG
jgi:hypothetical protein